MQGSLLSIIIPTFNSEKTIAECIKSILVQSFENIEVLIIDGCSTDKTIEIIQQYESQLPIKYYIEKDEGIYDAMNKGIEKAGGSYLYFLGSDDTIYDQNVMLGIAELISQGNEKVIYGNIKMNGRHEFIKDGTVYGGEFDLKRLLSHNIPHQGIFYPKSLFAKIGSFNPKYEVLADHDLNLRAFAEFTFKYVDHIIANFTLGGTSSLQKDEEFEKDKIKNFIKYYLNKIHRKEFIPLRFYVQQAAFNNGAKVSILTRLYLIFVYAKLKIQSLYY
ncbi:MULTISPECIES: glycosyltransferase family 2 protein [unclassified Pedobacter]|uniref:glycosyltransferase family 2 protein n=1 Tax=unclassified Pedobacter TaxID=2628915 RepID=UPI001D86EB73|nr:MULTISPECIES: glycosyltransferase family 2 protein [unclassified Pedobacter]CAH0166240.1 PGL/p-HBAD biosynthesis glycosyltransferase Rv2957 [Pedobacter sp. Bi126]CAH0284733.1 PGL/p-HBAD biosynthesis glycosyltransferase Rv2957 [Pedobacter sp. Bi36]